MDELTLSEPNSQSADRQTSIPGTASALHAQPSRSPTPPAVIATAADEPPKRKRGRPPKDRSVEPPDALTTLREEQRRLREREDELKLRIAAEERRLKASQAEVVGRTVISEMKRSENVAKLVRAILMRSGLSPSERKDIGPLLGEEGKP